MAATSGDYRAIKGLGQCPNVDINTENGKGMTALYLASWIGRKEAVKELLDVANIDENKNVYLNGQTAYSIASEKGHFEIMKLLTHSHNLYMETHSHHIDVNKGWFLDSWPSLLLLSRSEIFHITTDTSSNQEKGKLIFAF